MHRGQGHGFALIEALVVVGLLGVLALRFFPLALSDVDVPDPAGGRMHEVLWKRGKALDVRLYEPAHSPVAGWCAFAGEDAKGRALFVVDAGKPGPQRRLEAASENLTRDLAFSPDGNHVLFSTNQPDRP